MLADLRRKHLEFKGFPTLWLGIDIGGSKVAVALADADGRIRARRRRPVDPAGDPSDELARIAADARALLAELGAESSALAGAGVSAPGPLDAERGLLLGPPNLPRWQGTPVAPWLRDALGVPVRLENDANAGALAEWRFGAGRGRRSLAFLTMSTGVGAGLVVDGALLRGRAGNAGEIGHVPVVWDGEPCACGLRGCLEAYIGGAAWTNRLRRAAPASSRVVELAGGRERITPEHVLAAAGAGDVFACDELARYNGYLARALVGLVFTFAPELIVLGTIPSAAGEALCFEPLREQVRARVWPVLASGLEIVPSALGPELADHAGIAVAMQGGASERSSSN
jgi:glucokinase